MGLVLACVIRILQDDWSIRLGANRPEGARKHLAAMLSSSNLLLLGYGVSWLWAQFSYEKLSVFIGFVLLILNSL